MATKGIPETISTLNGLIEICKDGQQGFRLSADAIENAQIKSLFDRYSSERARMSTELQQEVGRIGGDAEASGSVVGAAHRGWINIKSVITGKDENAIISEAERGEDAAKEAYANAIEAELPEPTHTLVLEQYEKVLAAHDEVRNLKRSTAK